MLNILSIGGLLSTFKLVNVDEASRSVDQARMAAERALYLGQRMPMMLRWQTEFFYFELAASPEAKNLMRLSKTMEGFPAVMASERKAAIEQWGAECRAVVWQAAMALMAVAVFCLALLFRIISKKI